MNNKLMNSYKIRYKNYKKMSQTQMKKYSKKIKTLRDQKHNYKQRKKQTLKQIKTLKISFKR